MSYFGLNLDNVIQNFGHNSHIVKVNENSSLSDLEWQINLIVADMDKAGFFPLDTSITYIEAKERYLATIVLQKINLPQSLSLSQQVLRQALKSGLITVDFKALTEEGVKKLLDKFFSDYAFSEKLIHRLCAYGSVTPGDFGKLSDTIKFMDPKEITGEYIIEQLCEIQEEKDSNGGASRKIGFCA